MKRTHPIFSGTLVLTGVMLLLRGLGLFYQVCLAKFFSAAQLGQLELFMAVYGFATTLAVSGVRLSATRLIVIGRTRGCAPRTVLRKSCLCSLLFGVAAMLLLWSISPFAARHWLGSESYALPMRILAGCLPFLSLESCFGGYYTAVGKATTFTSIQIPQQLFALGLCLLLLRRYLPKGMQTAYTALAAGMLIAEIAGALLLLVLCPKPEKSRSPCTNLTYRDFFRIALPDAGSSWLRSALLSAKSLLIPRGLGQACHDPEAALAVYGTIQSMTFPVLTFPAVLISAFNILLLPEIAQCHESGQVERLRHMAKKDCSAALFYAMSTGAFLFLAADWVGGTLFPGAGTAQYLRWLAPLVPLMYVDSTVDTFLKGMGLQVSSMFYNIIDAAVSLSMVLVLVPRMGIPGYLLVLYTSEILNLCLSTGKLRKVLRLRQKEPTKRPS